MKHWKQERVRKKYAQYAGAALLLIACAGIGARVHNASFAASPTASIEAESGTVSAAASKATDTSASASQAVKFGSAAAGGTRTCPAYPLPPDSSCTGVPTGTTLTTVNGSVVTSTSGQTISDKLITGDLVISNSNITVKNTRVLGRVINNNSLGVTFTDSDIGPDTCPSSSSPYNNLNGSNYTLIRTHVHNAGADIIGIGGTGNINIQDSIINQACFYPGDHLDAAQFYAPGNTGIVSITHSLLDSRAVNASANGNAAIFWADNPGSGSRLTVTQSWLAGGNYTASLYDATATSGVILDINNTTFVKNSYTYGACSSSNSVGFNGTSGIKFTNNRYDDGSSFPSC